MKAIAIIDKKPDSCEKCQFCCESYDRDQFGLSANRKYSCVAMSGFCRYFNKAEDLHRLCPLKEVPEWVLEKIVGDSK